METRDDNINQDTQKHEKETTGTNNERDQNPAGGPSEEVHFLENLEYIIGVHATYMTQDIE